jgi:hypothetical protein
MLRTALALSALSATVASQTVGPSTSTPCYVLPNASLPPGQVSTTSLLTAGDVIGGYRLVGVPDGMGVFVDAGELTIVVNHELAASQGISRAHGSTGAFVSRWSIEAATKAMLSGRDHNTAAADVHPYDRLTSSWYAGTFAYSRFCSGDLAPVSAYSFGTLGTTSRIYLAGEEIRPPAFPRHGSAWAHVLTGPAANQTWELPHLGQISWENAIASPFPQVKTIVMCTDDSSASTSPSGQPSELYVYVGDKQGAGNDVTKAGLTGGTLYGVRVSANGSVVPEESDAYGLGSGPWAGSGTFELVSLGDASTFIGSAQQAAAVANDVFRMQRVEDGAWDVRPGFENDFYFVTTASTSTNSRLWRLRFTAIGQPALGGQIDIILTGAEGQKMMDNVCADAHGRLFLQEDPGGSPALAKIWMYDLDNGRLTEVAAHDPAFFQTGSPGFLTTSEESSGIVPAFDLLGDGWYLFDVMNPSASPDPELVAGGQLLAMYVDPALGRDLELWYSSPWGSGSISSHLRFGAPNGVFFSPVALSPGSFPNGSFFGIDVAFADLVSQFLAGAPFTSTLDAAGAYDSITFAGLPPGLTIYGVAIDDVFSVTPQASAPVAYTIP